MNVIAPPVGPDVHGRDPGTLLHNLGVSLLDDDRVAEAVEVFAETVVVSRRLGYPTPLWAAVAALGHLSMTGRCSTAAGRTVIRALAPVVDDTAARPGPLERGLALVGLGVARSRLGQVATATTDLERAVREIEEAGGTGVLRSYRDLQAAALLGLATARHRAGEPAPEAEEAATLLRALAIRESAVYDPYLGDALTVAAGDARRRRDLTRALNWANEAVAACLADPDRRARAQTVLSEVLADLRRFAESVHVLGAQERRTGCAEARWTIRTDA